MRAPKSCRTCYTNPKEVLEGRARGGGSVSSECVLVVRWLPGDEGMCPLHAPIWSMAGHRARGRWWGQPPNALGCWVSSQTRHSRWLCLKRASHLSQRFLPTRDFLGFQWFCFFWIFMFPIFFFFWAIEREVWCFTNCVCALTFKNTRHHENTSILSTKLKSSVRTGAWTSNQNKGFESFREKRESSLPIPIHDGARKSKRTKEKEREEE